jgi:hypothetical protein
MQALNRLDRPVDEGGRLATAASIVERITGCKRQRPGAFRWWTQIRTALYVQSVLCHPARVAAAYGMPAGLPAPLLSGRWLSCCLRVLRFIAIHPRRGSPRRFFAHSTGHPIPPRFLRPGHPGERSGPPGPPSQKKNERVCEGPRPVPGHCSLIKLSLGHHSPCILFSSLLLHLPPPTSTFSLTTAESATNRALDERPIHFCVVHDRIQAFSHHFRCFLRLRGRRISVLASSGIRLRCPSETRPRRPRFRRPNHHEANLRNKQSGHQFLATGWLFLPFAVRLILRWSWILHGVGNWVVVGPRARWMFLCFDATPLDTE